MKKPIIDQHERFIVIHFPDSFSAADINRRIAVMHFRRDIENAIDETLIKIHRAFYDCLETMFDNK